MTSPRQVQRLITDNLWPALVDERRHLDVIDRWYRWSHDRPHQPRQATTEYRQLAERAQTPWLGLVVTTVAQELYVEGYRAAQALDNSAPWRWWQANGMDARQIAVHRAALAYGYSYVTVLPGQGPDGDRMPVIRGVSPRMMEAFYGEPAYDEWPAYALSIEPAKVNDTTGWNLRFYDDTDVHFLHSEAGGSGLRWIESREHNTGVCPVVRYANMLDLEGRADGEVEPFIPIAGRVDQTTFDRLVVQRFSSWVVRTIAGMAKPESADEADAERLRLKVEDILIASDPDTKFGSLPATPLDGFIDARDADIRDLAAVTQTPPHHLLGQMANLSAEALAAAEASLSRKVEERKHAFGESHEQVLRLAARVMGDTDGARDTSAQVRWRDMESRSLAQTADALGKLAKMLQVPVEMLWEKIPGWTDQDVERAKSLAASSSDPIQALADELAGSQRQPSVNGQAAPGIPTPAV